MLPLLRIGTQARWTPMTTEGRATIIVISHNRRVQLLSTLKSLQQLPGNWPIIVIDNGSTDGTAAVVASHFPSIMLIRAQRNLGAAARNIGVAYAHTPYIAFSDDDTRSEEHTSELQSLMRISYAVFCLKK